jgi:hypothetical protein
MRARVIPVFALVVLAGCSKIHESKTFTVEPGDSYTLQVTAPLSEQKVQVVLTSDQPVNIWVLLEKDVPSGKDDFDPESIKSGILASEKAKTQATLSATIPAKEKYRVYVNGAAKKANVTVKIDSQ